jgi:tRNA threonylcarbamoyladenosine biosynthesis protein TsaB
MAIILGIGTSSPALSLAVFHNGQIAGHIHEMIGRGHAERLVPALQTLLAGRTADEVVVDIGPGSFTGIRVGIAAAQALGLAWGVPVTGVKASSLVAAAAFAGHDTKHVTVALDAGRGQFFCQHMDRNFNAGEGHLCAEADLPRPPSDVASDVAGDMLATARPDMASLLLVPEALRRLSPQACYIRPPDAKLPL